jgi:ATP-dependent DNA helicase DinG
VSEGVGAVRLGPSGIGEPVDDFEVQEALARVVSGLEELAREIAELRARLEIVDELAEGLEGRVLDLRSIERRVSAAIQGLNLVLAPGEEGKTYVRWLEKRGQGRHANLVLGAAPTELGTILRESLFTQLDSSVLTSATLSTRNSFDFVRSRLGLRPTELSKEDNVLEVKERIILSSFDFRRQALLAVPTDLPPAERGEPEFQEATADAVVELAELSRGGLFVLFTSHASLKHVAELIRARDLEDEWPLFVQGEGDRSQLLERFVTSGSGVLLGTASFWEGVDVPGEPLRGLVIQKLPFRVPTEPITAARMEMIERTGGGDPFHQFMLPHAALRLKQGFGRLIRSQTDRGVVLVLDDRLVTKRYGRYLRESLPDVPIIKGAWSDLHHRLASFYKGVGPSPMALGTRGAAR